MKFVYDAVSGGGPIVRKYPVFGNASNINVGAAVMRGATPGTNQPFAILATGALADVIGVIEVTHTSASAADDSNVGGTLYTTRSMVINPFAVFRIEYDLTDTMAVASTSGTTVTITSIEDNIDGGYVYAVSGTGAGRLAFITAADGSTVTTKETTGWDSTTTLIKILPLWHQLVKLNSTADKIGTDAAAGSGLVTVLGSYIESDSIPHQPLDPTKHSGLTGLNSLNVKFSADIIFRNHALNTID